MPDGEPLVTVDRLAIRSENRTILSGGALVLRRGEGVALVGPSGSGKTLTIYAILDLLNCYAPEIAVDAAIRWPTVTRAGLRIGYVPQGTSEHLHPYLPIRRQIHELVAWSRARRAASLNDDQVREMLNSLRIVPAEQILRAYPHMLSGGMRQRVLLAVALLSDPDLIILDEPTSALDGMAKSAAYQELLSQRRRGTALLIATHDMREATILADELIAIRQGKLAAEDPAVLRAQMAEASLARTSLENAAAQATESSRSAANDQTEGQREEVWIADHVTIRSGRRPGGRFEGSTFEVKDFSCVVRRGEALGLVGETGCGKTTTIRGLALLAPTYGGSVRLGTTVLTGLSRGAVRQHRARFQVIFQDSYLGLNPYLSVRQLFLEPAAVHGTPPPPDEQIVKILSDVGLEPEVLKTTIGTLSYGQKQRVAICRALVSFPDLELLLMDEPLTALDSVARTKMIAVLRAQRLKGMAMVISSHDLDLISELCDGMVVLRHGRIVEALEMRPWAFQTDYGRLFWDAFHFVGQWPPGSAASLRGDPSEVE